MDSRTLIAELVGALVWPVTTIVVVLLLRRQLSRLASLLQRFKYKDFQFDFGRQVEEAKEEAAGALGEVSYLADQGAPEASRLTRLAEISPRAAVLEAFTTVEIEVLDAAHRLGLQKGFPTLTYRALQYLEDSGLLDDSLVSVLRDLRGLRNQAAHSPEFALTRRDALEYIQLSLASLSRLRVLKEAANQAAEPGGSTAG